MIEFISLLTFCVCYIVATVIKNKIDIIIQEHERATKIQINPNLYKYITYQLIAMTIGSVGAGIFIGLII